MARPDPSMWPPERVHAFASAGMHLFRQCLALPGAPTLRAAVLEDLHAFTGLPPDECLARCLGWEDESIAEWHAADRSTPAGVTQFYRTTRSWLFDLLWYAYLQAEGYAEPLSVIALHLACAHAPGADHLDFGSGAGVTAQLFARSGYRTSLADVSDTLLSFAQDRLRRRGEQARAINLNEGALPTAAYDVITSIDTLVCVDDLRTTAADLHRALRPGGCLIANLYPRPQASEIAWARYEDAFHPRADVVVAGFAPVRRCGNFTVYRRADPSTPAQRARVVCERAVLTGRPRQVLHRGNVLLAAALRGEPLVTRSLG
jgi:SAM-dependent methyltransferase